MGLFTRDGSNVREIIQEARRNPIKSRASADELLKIPEIDNAVSELVGTRELYWNALHEAFINSRDEDLPDLGNVHDEFMPRLKHCSDYIAELLEKYSQ